ncbi:MMPL family transporter [bacterium]|nr:MMPL family transporter [bacterium]
MYKFIGKFLKKLTRFIYTYSRIIVPVAIALAIISGWYAYRHLVFDSDQANLIKRSDALQAEQDLYVEAFPDAEDIVVIVENGTKEQREKFIESLVARLAEEPEVFSDILAQIDFSKFSRYVLHFMKPEELEDMAKLLQDNEDIINAIVCSSTFLDCLMAVDFVDKPASDPHTIAELLPIINNFVDIFSQCMEERGRVKKCTPWSEALVGDFKVEEREAFDRILTQQNFQRYCTVAGDRFYVLSCRPYYREGEDKSIASERAVERMRVILDELCKANKDVLVGLTGEIVLNVDEAQSSTRDSLHSAILSLFLIALVFIWAFRECWPPLMAICGLVIGISWTLGFTTLVIGHLNLLTVTCATILMGLGIDFGIHLLYRYDEERGLTRNPLTAMEKTLMGAGYENLMGAVSTAVAFLSLAFTNFTGVAELGIIAGSGIILCLVSMSLVLPSLIFWREGKGYSRRVSQNINRFDLLAKWEKKLLNNPEIAVSLGIALTVLSLIYAYNIKYDYNLLNLQAKGLQSVVTERHLLNSSDHSLLCGISLQKDPVSAREMAQKFSKLKTVASVETVAYMIPSDYDSKREFLRKIVKIMHRIPEPLALERDKKRSRIQEFKKMEAFFLSKESDSEDFLQQMSQSSDPRIAAEAQKLRQKLEHLSELLSTMGPGALDEGLEAFEREFYSNLHNIISFMHRQNWEPEFTLKDIPEDLYRREVGKNGLIQVRIFPKEDVWEREAQERFVKDLQSVDPKVVGMPVMAYYDCQSLREANERAGVWALAAIWILLFIHFRSISTAVLALLPKVLGIIWMVGFMGVTHTDFNSADSLALPLILGIGLVFGIHIIHRISEEDGGGIFSHSTGPSITLAALTTIIGFATMINAEHQGIATLGLVMTFGVSANLLSSAVFMPSLFSFLRKYFNYKVNLHK